MADLSESLLSVIWHLPTHAHVQCQKIGGSLPFDTITFFRRARDVSPYYHFLDATANTDDAA